ncbi:BUD32 family EKC/KEOPS complex subunit [Acaryochloris marina]|uniref:hypothetical protein n=1 Tax=Acaryochloris marina TaxID=155978 RepID=UPI0021C3F416|nr:hypothetical protein [Acaryochloris marina]BDM83790.1 hypothetical protein AM10699_66510 [Acaryochloris marina MBIC10699]
MTVLYPTRSEYLGSINNPKFAFMKIDSVTHMTKSLDESLVLGQPAKFINNSGQEVNWLACGNFACVFKYKTYSPSRIWAVRCFLKSKSDVIYHYEQLSKYFKNISCKSYFVDFDLIKEGIRVNGNIYPILKMQWVEGKNIKDTIKCYLGNRKKLRELAESWLNLTRDLYAEGIAHGDLQHGNILVLEDSSFNLKLIDYDSLFFEEYNQGAIDEIKGISGYQHPYRKYIKNQCIEIDFFSNIVIYLSILVFAEKPDFWNIFNVENSERLLFSESDFVNPSDSDIFKRLSDLSLEIRIISSKLNEICELTDFSEIPSLAEVLNSSNLQKDKLINKDILPFSTLSNSLSSNKNHKKATNDKLQKEDSNKNSYQPITFNKNGQSTKNSSLSNHRNISKIFKKVNIFEMISFKWFLGTVSLFFMGALFLTYFETDKLRDAEASVNRSDHFKDLENYSACVLMAQDALEYYQRAFLVRDEKIKSKALSLFKTCQIKEDSNNYMLAGELVDKSYYIDSIKEAQKVTKLNSELYENTQELIEDSVDVVMSKAEKKYENGDLKIALKDINPLLDVLLPDSTHHKQVEEKLESWQNTWNVNSEKHKKANSMLKTCEQLGEAEKLARSLTTKYYKSKAESLFSKIDDCINIPILELAESHYKNRKENTAITLLSDIPNTSKHYNEAMSLQIKWERELNKYNETHRELKIFIDRYFDLINSDKDQNYENAYYNYLTDNFRENRVNGSYQVYKSYWKPRSVNILDINIEEITPNGIRAIVTAEITYHKNNKSNTGNHEWCFIRTNTSFKFDS